MSNNDETNAPSVLVALARENPFRFFTLSEAGKILGLGRDVMTKIAEANPPMVGKKINLTLLLEWMKANASKIGKTTRQ